MEKPKIQFKIESQDLRLRQSLDLETKILMSRRRIQEFYNQMGGKVYIAYSGGNDSLALLLLVRELYPEVPAVFNDSGIEYPEIKARATAASNVVILKPKMYFHEVIEKYGWPVISKRISRDISEIRSALKSYNFKTINRILKYGFKTKSKHFLIDSPFLISPNCCHYIKKYPAAKYQKETGRAPFLGILAAESSNRKLNYMKFGCNYMGTDSPHSWPIAFWTSNDVKKFLEINNIPEIAPYNLGQKNTGCAVCLFGFKSDLLSRFEILKNNYPKLHNYFCKIGGERVLKFITSEGSKSDFIKCGSPYVKETEG